MLKHGSICDWAAFSKSRIWAMFENRFFPGNIPIPKTFSFNQGSICDLLDFYKKPGTLALYCYNNVWKHVFLCKLLELTHPSPSGRFRPGKIADFLGLLDHVCTVWKINTTNGLYLCYPCQKTEPIYHIYNPF